MTAATAPTRIDLLLARLGQTASDSLRRELLQPAKLQPGLTVAKVLAYALAIIVFGLSALALVLGIWLILAGGFFPILVGVALVGIAWLSRPRINKVPPDVVAPEAVPELKALSDRVAHAVATRRADLIRFEPSFNAGVSEAGWRQKRILTIGLPLFAVLAPQERIAILAHEFAHYSNGDPRRGFLLNSAFATLVVWYDTLAPRSLMDVEDEGMPGLVMLPVNLVMAGLALIPLSLGTLLISLILRSSQRAEYLADVQSATVGGSAAATSALDKLHLGHHVEAATGAATDEHWENRNLWDELRRRVREIPEREHERARRLDRAMAARVDLTHPPNSFRIQVINDRSATIPTLTLTDVDTRSLDAELRAVMESVQELAIDDYQDSLRKVYTVVREDFG